MDKYVYEKWLMMVFITVLVGEVRTIVRQCMRNCH